MRNTSSLLDDKFDNDFVFSLHRLDSYVPSVSCGALESANTYIRPNVLSVFAYRESKSFYVQNMLLIRLVRAITLCT